MTTLAPPFWDPLWKKTVTLDCSRVRSHHSCCWVSLCCSFGSFSFRCFWVFLMYLLSVIDFVAVFALILFLESVTYVFWFYKTLNFCLQIFLFCSSEPSCKSHWGPCKLGCSYIPLIYYIFVRFFFLKYIFFRPNFSSRFSSSASILWIFTPFLQLKTSIWFFQWLCRLLNLLYLTVFRTQSVPGDFILWMFLACRLVCILRDHSHSVLIVCVPVHTILRSAVVAWSRLCSVSAELTNSGAGAPQSHTDTNDKYTCQ